MTQVALKNVGVLRHLYLLSLCRKKTERSFSKFSDLTEIHTDLGLFGKMIETYAYAKLTPMYALGHDQGGNRYWFV